MRIRLGFSETTLLFFYYLDKNGIDNSNYNSSQNGIINWLFSTSGFYDKQIEGTYFNFNATIIKKSAVYNSYFERVFNIVKKQNNACLCLCFHKIHPSLDIYKEQFLNEICYYVRKYENVPSSSLFAFMHNKNILIINNLGILMKNQYESGNIKKIRNDFPDTVKSIQYLNNGYSFLNSGPDESILETAEKLCNRIKTYDFDGAIISTGAYSCLLFDYIVNELTKEAYISGGELPAYFGIITNRTKPTTNNEYWIKVPDDMKPENYEKIEGGTYW